MASLWKGFQVYLLLAMLVALEASTVSDTSTTTTSQSTTTTEATPSTTTTPGATITIASIMESSTTPKPAELPETPTVSASSAEGSDISAGAQIVIVIVIAFGGSGIVILFVAFVSRRQNRHEKKHRMETSSDIMTSANIDGRLVRKNQDLESIYNTDDGYNNVHTTTIARGTWGSQLDFILSCVGYAVGLGNVWRFPYLAYRNGGATFLFPYIIMLVIAGLPLFFLELALGQFTSQGPITVWSMSPFFSGIGFAMVIISGVVCIYYNVIITYALYYMFVSFVYLDDALPWSTCTNWWNSKDCRDTPYPVFDDMNETMAMQSITTDIYTEGCLHDKMLNATFISQELNMTFPGVISFDMLNSTIIRHDLFKVCRKSFVSPASDYFSNFVLRLPGAGGIGELGGISLKIILTLALAWLLIFVCLMKGIKSSGKVVYFTATFPYIILFVLLIRGVTLDGHMQGIYFYIIPNWERLQDPKVWADAATQIFYSLGIGFGGMLTMASYSKFKNNVYRDAITVGVIDCCTSIFAGFTIFSLLGHMAHVTNQNIEDVADSGPGLAFVVYPEGITKLPASSLWAFLFFFMILTLGLDSQFAMMETVISGITDLFPRVLRRYKTLFTFITCVIGFLLGIPQTTKGGIYVLTLMDWYSGSYNLMIVALCEIICLMYVYGYKNFCEDIHLMIGIKPSIYWLATWLVITPAAILFIIISAAVDYTKAYYGKYVFEDFAEGLGWMMVATPVAAIFIIGFVQMVRYGVPACFKPLPSWGPANPQDRTGRYDSLSFNKHPGLYADNQNVILAFCDNIAYTKSQETFGK